MSSSDTCPQASVLDQLAAGELPSDLESALIRHIDQCALCRQTMDAQTSKHPFAEFLPGLRTSGIDSPLLRVTLRKVKSQQNPWSPHRSETEQNAHSLHADSFAWSADGFDEVQPVGRGGMGVVFKAREKSLDRIVAIKVLSPMLSADPSARERFLREARAAAAIKHPNVITIHSVDGSSSLPYLVMEFVEGQSMQQRLDEQGTFDADEVIRIGHQIAAGLAAAHASGVVHRDVKPANILLESPSGNVKLSDFGLARVTGQTSLTQTGILVGTPAFIAPELFHEDGEHDHRADLFSLGGVMYAMLAGESPFDTGSVLATLHRISTADPAPIKQHAPGVPDGLATMIHKLLAKDPAKRFRSAEDVVTALQSRAASERLPVEHSPPVQPPPIQKETVSVRKTRSERENHRPFLKWILIAVGVNFVVASLAILLLITSSSHAEFLVITDDGRSEEYRSLEVALAEAEDGSRVEIHSDGPLVLPAVFFEQSELVVSAGPGFEPVIFLETEQEERIDEDENEEFPGLINSFGELTIEGLELRIAADEDEHEGYSLVHVSDGSFTAERCRFLSEPGGHCVTGDATTEVFLSGCDLHVSDGTAVNLILEDEENARVTMDNCVITGTVGIRIEVVEACRLSLNRCTIIAPRAIEVMYDEPFGSNDQWLGVSAARSIFATLDALVTVYDADSDPSSFSSAFRWEGASNLYSSPFVVIANDRQTNVPTWGRTLQRWTTVARESNSRYATEPFGFSDAELWDLVVQPGEMDVRELPLRDDLRSGVDPIGANRRFHP